jgi:hypothetical protein
MNQEEIRKRHQTITSFLNKWYDELEALQLLCTHPDINVRYESNSGNYDPGANSSWSIHKCPDCYKIWTEDED